jgi:hypothetical protein
MGSDTGKGFYVRLGNSLFNEVAWHQKVRRRGHGLCACLNDLSKGLDRGRTLSSPTCQCGRGCSCSAFLGLSPNTRRDDSARHPEGTRRDPSCRLAKALHMLIPLV